MFDVSRRSVERYWKRQQEEATFAPKPRGGYRRSRLEGYDEVLRGWIDQESDLSLSQMREHLLEQFGIRIGTTALWHRLEKLGLSYKKNAACRRTKPA